MSKHDENLTAVAAAAELIRAATTMIDRAGAHLRSVEALPADVALLRPDMDRVEHHLRAVEHGVYHLLGKLKR